MTNTILKTAIAGIALFAALTATSVQAETRLTLKTGGTSSSYYQMAVQLAEALKAGTNGDVIATVEDSQGSVQNVMESGIRSGNYIFSTPPALINQAMEGEGAFEGKTNPKFADIRALFPFPSLTMHFVAKGDEGVISFSDLEGKSILLGKGSFGAREGEKYLGLFGLNDKVTVADAELGNAVAALKNRQIDAFVTAGSYPAPNVIEAAAGSGVSIVSMTDEEVAETGRTRLVIPAGTYPGVDEDVITTSLPVIIYAGANVSDDTAYLVTKTFWEQKEKLVDTAPWWRGVTPEMLESVTSKMHPGAIRYYEEIGIDVPASIR